MREDIREDGTVEGYQIETHYRHCKHIANDDGFLRVVADDDIIDIETRIPFKLLEAAGWVKKK